MHPSPRQLGFWQVFGGLGAGGRGLGSQHYLQEHAGLGKGIDDPSVSVSNPVFAFTLGRVDAMFPVSESPCRPSPALSSALQHYTTALQHYQHPPNSLLARLCWLRPPQSASVMAPAAGPARRAGGDLGVAVPEPPPSSVNPLHELYELSRALGVIGYG